MIVQVSPRWRVQHTAWQPQDGLELRKVEAKSLRMPASSFELLVPLHDLVWQPPVENRRTCHDAFDNAKHKHSVYLGILVPGPHAHVSRIFPQPPSLFPVRLCRELQSQSPSNRLCGQVKPLLVELTIFQRELELMIATDSPDVPLGVSSLLKSCSSFTCYWTSALSRTKDVHHIPPLRSRVF